MTYLHLYLVGLDALVQGAHILLRQITTIVNAAVVSQVVLDCTQWCLTKLPVGK